MRHAEDDVLTGGINGNSLLSHGAIPLIRHAACVLEYLFGLSGSSRVRSTPSGLSVLVSSSVLERDELAASGAVFAPTHPTLTGTKVMVSLPKMSTTLTATV